jgi:hypothetical protein
MYNELANKEANKIRTPQMAATRVVDRYTTTVYREEGDKD